MARKFYYGGQAVIEGVMMRGQRHMAVAVRKPSGEITVREEPLRSGVYVGGWSKVPIVRGIATLAETLVLGVKALMWSANASLEEEDVEITPRMMGSMLAISLTFGIAIFFVAPLLVSSWFHRLVPDPLLVNILEGAIRMLFFLAYIVGIGFMPNVRRVFQYHGAEHKAVNAYEGGAPMTVEAVDRFTTRHTRCGTSFLLIVMVVAIVLFALLGRPDFWLLLASRILLVPVVAAISYELIRFSANHYKNPLVRAIFQPGLWLQGLTTRQPSPDQIEVAIAALRRVLIADGVVVEASEAEKGGAKLSGVPAPQPS